MKHRGCRPSTVSRKRINLDPAPDVIFAVGDIHGCFDQLVELENLIAHMIQQDGGAACVIHLGDSIDRGPRSADVIDYLIKAPHPSFRSFCLLGNHEQMMLDFVRNVRRDHLWLDVGGWDTLASYGIRKRDWSNFRLAELVAEAIPPEHIAFLESLPIMIRAQHHCFVHAGLVPHRSIDDQTDDDLISYRWTEEHSTDGLDVIVVHGHTPVAFPMDLGFRINVDTGAYFSGKLSAVRLAEGAAPTFLSR